MPQAVIASAVRTPIGTAFKGALRDTPAELLAEIVVREAVARSGFAPESVDDILLAESMYGGGDLARYAAVAAGLVHAPGVALNRHCAGSLAAVSLAAGSVRAGMDEIVVAGGAMATSLSPQLSWRVPGTQETRTSAMPPTFPHYEGADDDVTISVGWNTAVEAGLTRPEVDAWALRSHERAIAAIDAGVFEAEIVPVPVTGPDGPTDFTVDEHPKRSTSAERLASLKPLHPEIADFSVTAGNSAGVNDAAAALVVASDRIAQEQGAEALATVEAWASVGVEPHRTGMAATEVIPVVLKRAGLEIADIDLWEINEAFASVPLAACRAHGIDEAHVNIYGSGCSLGHPVAATGARMLTTLVHELRRRGGGTAVAAMCAGGGQGSAVVIRVD